MAKNKKKKELRGSIKTETKHGIWAIIFFVLAIFLLMSKFGIAGVVGHSVYGIFDYLLGVGYILLPLLFILLSSSFLKSQTPNLGLARSISSILFLLSGLGIVDIVSGTHSGGFLGEILSAPFVSLFDIYASVVFLSAIVIISVLIIFDTKLELPEFLKNIFSSFSKKIDKKEEEEEVQ